MIGAQLYSILSGNAGVASRAGDRIFPQVLPQGGSLPAIRYAVIDDVPENTLEAFSLRNARVQLDCFAKTYVSVQALADAVSGALATYSDATLSALLLGRRDGYEDETELHVVSMDFSLWVGR